MGGEWATSYRIFPKQDLHEKNFPPCDYSGKRRPNREILIHVRGGDSPDSTLGGESEGDEVVGEKKMRDSIYSSPAIEIGRTN